MEHIISRVIIRSLPVIAGAVGAWVLANFTILHSAFCFPTETVEALQEVKQ